jgi:hypothetical protein
MAHKLDPPRPGGEQDAGYQDLVAYLDAGDLSGAEDALGQTVCEHGCYVEPDGSCPHGKQSLGLRMGLI